MTDPPSTAASTGLSLAPFRALRPAVGSDRLARMLCPPYDVIDESERARLLAADRDNAVAVVLPEADDGMDAYAAAARRLERWVADGVHAVDAQPALYVYEISDGGGSTRGLLGAVELRQAEEGVILPHENTMAGPVADRLALMRATQANVEPIYLVYDGGGLASQVVRAADQEQPLAHARTSDGLTHTLWAVTDPVLHRDIAADLATRRALIADGHHRYATYLEFQRECQAQQGPGPWDRGLSLLVDSSTYGPQVHAIHRVLVGVPPEVAIRRVAEHARTTHMASAEQALQAAGDSEGFAVVLTDGEQFVLVTEPDRTVLKAAANPDESDTAEAAALAELDVTVVHRGLVHRVWNLPDTADAVDYAHSVEQAITSARNSGGTAVLLRPTATAAVAAVAAAGARMPRKSTLFTPKPASGLVMRRFADQS